MKTPIIIVVLILVFAVFLAGCQQTDDDLAGEATYTAVQLYNMYKSQDCDQLTNTYSIHRARLDATIDVIKSKNCSGDLDKNMLGDTPTTDIYFSVKKSFSNLLSTRFDRGYYNCNYLYNTQYPMNLRRTNTTFEVAQDNDCDWAQAQVVEYNSCDTMVKKLSDIKATYKKALAEAEVRKTDYEAYIKFYNNECMVNETPVNVTPVNVTPVNVTPVNVTPVNVTPVNVTPVNVTVNVTVNETVNS